MEKKAIIYARVSSVGDRQNTDRQVSDLKTYASKNGIEIVRVFAEHISGAARNEDRPVLIEALAFAKCNQINIVLFSELSRLGRSVYEVQEAIKELRDAHVNAFFLKEGFSIFDDYGKESIVIPILVAVLGTAAQLERENIAYRLKSGRELAKRNGVKMGRKVGYRKPAERKKEEYAEVLKSLRKGNSLRDTAQLTGISLSTVKRLKKEFIKTQ